MDGFANKLSIESCLFTTRLTAIMANWRDGRISPEKSLRQKYNLRPEVADFLAALYVPTSDEDILGGSANEN